MPRISGVNIPDNKQISIALTYIFGIGRSLSEKILKETNIDFNKKAKDLTPKEISLLKEYIEKHYKIEGDLKRQLIMNIKRLKDFSCWRGVRHIKNLPVRGQTTKRNSRTIRGNVKKTVGSGRKAPPTAK